MFELLFAAVALVAVLSISYFRGRSKKQDALSRVLAAPEDVMRVYLRHAPELEAYWLHVQFRDGRKRMLAAPWELDQTLPLLAGKGVRLSDGDLALLAAGRARAAAPAGQDRKTAASDSRAPLNSPARAGA